MPFDAYVELCKVINTTKPRSFRETFGNELALVDTVLDAKSDDMLDSARRIACFPTESSRKDYSTFLSDMFVHIIKEIYIAKPDLAHSEAILNQAVVWPAIRATLHAINDTHDDLSFYPGEEQLQSMTTQRRVNDGQHDERSVYKADAIIRTSDGLEIALAETSNGYNEGTQSKVFFDFHKGIYGAASMLKTIADRYKYANYSLMSELKIFFWHIHSTKIRLWSLSCPSPGIFIVYREDSCVIPVSFNDDQKIPLDYIRFIWCFKEQLDQIMRTLHVLRESHQLNMKQYRYYPLPADKDLSEIVKPSIIKVTEKVHSK
ncbi:hypothetical protein BCR43DRAFT_234156 [Syncephalastrum racemosum]|uniref:Fungal-type protein kinase domain-containing protein n=1 Tax=Syncephalastrum racemosum TaxID=13706 RepID=A0A1X2HEC1_SYNRA|nr:hypothetical protein BCR43DRAFT_234156 [Syncephalastrum racemosum]